MKQLFAFLLLSVAMTAGAQTQKTDSVLKLYTGTAPSTIQFVGRNGVKQLVTVNKHVPETLTVYDSTRIVAYQKEGGPLVVIDSAATIKTLMLVMKMQYDALKKKQ